MTSFDVTSNKNKATWNVLPLDTRLYWMLDAEKEFFKVHTGIQDDEELKQHVLETQRLAYAVVPYPCIRLFSFLRFNATRCTAYQQALMLGKRRPDAIFLDVGAGFGNDVRKLIADGYPTDNIVATDLHQGLWNAGHDLFKSNAKMLPVTFVPGDIFELTAAIEKAPPSNRPELVSLRSLVPLKGHISVIYAAHFFHLFNEHRGKELAERFAHLLSHEAGSVIFGLHLGAPEAILQTTPAGTMFCHSPTTWKSMWRSVFPSESVKVEAEVVKGHQNMAKAYAGSIEDPTKIWLLVWSVERL
ncbi:hypothetical protein K439DRAFT_1341562 [Ramaria rubella]|nr:hypothetical protein K439DRAFT_1341562 [Ramaria rubella]